MSDSPKKKITLTPAMRAGLNLKILRTAKENPEFEKELIRRMEEKNNKKPKMTRSEMLKAQAFKNLMEKRKAEQIKKDTNNKK
jgi:hypothetical protein